jgi:hypothetical protein
MVRKIKVDPDYDEDIAIIGISCHKPDYRIALELNKSIHLNLVHQPFDLCVFDQQRNVELCYPVFFYADPDTQVSFYLIPNHHPNGKLFPDQKMMDYFMLITGIMKNEAQLELIADIKKIPQVLTAHNLNLKKIKNLREFISDIELLMIKIKNRKKKRF